MIIFSFFIPIPKTTAFRIIPSEKMVTSINLGESNSFNIKIIADPNKPSDIGEMFVFTLEYSAFPDTYRIVSSRSIVPYCKISYDKNARLGDKKPVMAELSILVPSNIAKRGSFFGDLLVTTANAQTPITNTIHLFVTVRGEEPLTELQKVEPKIKLDTATQVITANLENTGDLSFATEGGEAIIRNPLSGEAIQKIELIPEGDRRMKTIFPEDSKLFTGKIEKDNPLFEGSYPVEINIPVVYPAIEEGGISKTVPATTTTTACISKKISEKIWGKLSLFEVNPPEIERFFVGKSLSKRLLVKNNSTQKLKIKAEYPTDGWIVVDPAEFTLIDNREIYLDFKNPDGKELKGEVIFTAYNELGEAVGEPVELDIYIFGK
ncbi:MAG: hypothetical protein V1891_00605 [bacterium]